jgi:hypothetical protein
MLGKIVQIIKPAETLYNLYVAKFVLEKDKERIAEVLDVIKSEGYDFHNNLEEIAKDYAGTQGNALVEQIHVFALALIERGKKTSVEPLHLVKGQLVTSDDVEGYLGMIGEGEPDDGGFSKYDATLKALELLRDG